MSKSQRPLPAVFVAILLSGVLPVARSGAAAGGETIGRANLLLARARALVALRRPENGPFDLAAHCRSRDLRAAARCSYHVTWISAGTWREELRVGDFSQERGALDGRGWRLRSGAEWSLPAEELTQLLDVSHSLNPSKDAILVGAAERKAENLRVLEVTLRSPDQQRWVLYLDEAAGLPLATARNDSRDEYVDWRPLGDAAFPGKLRRRRDERTVLEVTVDSLKGIPPADDAAFSPPPGAVVWAPCEILSAAEPLEKVTPAYPEAARLSRETGTVVVTGVIDVSGRVRDPRMARSSGHRELDGAALDAFRHRRFTPAECNGTPWESDTALAVTFALR